jgi:hypothetical protein
MPNLNTLEEIRQYLSKLRPAFEMQVEAVSLEVIDIAKQTSSALGEVSIDELKSVIIREFTNRLREPIIIDDEDKK